jgi:hypothetical protein
MVGIKITAKLIAPCGMDCSLCMRYQKDKGGCEGCRGSDEYKTKACIKCVIKNCSKLKDKYCFSCNLFPCIRLKKLDKRYRVKYKMSMIENLKNIDNCGIKKFIESENKKWKCRKCGRMICVHRQYCLNCGL